jgi:hypothetical protein
VIRSGVLQAMSDRIGVFSLATFVSLSRDG